MRRGLVLALLIAELGGCATSSTPDVPLAPMQPVLSTRTLAPANNPLGAIAGPTPESSYGAAAPVSLPPGVAGGGGDISLNFADTDIRTVVAQILGQILQVNYTIDPAVHGSATFHSTTPLSNAQLLPVLQALLSENGATLEQSGGLYNVVPTAAAGPSGTAAAGAAAGAGSVVVALRYADAATLAGVLQPFVGPGGRIAAAPGGNGLIIAGDSTTRQTLVDLVSAFDVDTLAGQSYTLLPVDDGSAKTIAESLQTALAGKGGSGDVRIVPLTRVNAILVVAAKPNEIEDVRRLFGLIVRNQSQQARSWNVYFLQASQADDLAYVLQQAFTPDNVTAVPSSARQSNSGAAATPGLGSAGIGSSALVPALAIPGSARPAATRSQALTAVLARPASARPAAKVVSPRRRGPAPPMAARRRQPAAPTRCSAAWAAAKVVVVVAAVQTKCGSSPTRKTIRCSSTPPKARTIWLTPCWRRSMSCRSKSASTR